MDANRFDSIAKMFADRRLSRRQAMVKGGTGLAAGAIAAAGLSAVARAQDATPAASGAAPNADHGPSMLFLQSFQQGGITPKAGAAGTYTLTLEQGLGQTIYFSDRPDRIVGAAPTPQFLAGLGFPPDNPPNAALIMETGAGDTDIAVVELLNPRYDDSSHTATYDVTLLKEWERTLDLGFTEPPTDLAQLHPTFGAAHLFIDDCPNHDMFCYTDPNSPSNSSVGTIPNSDHDGFCYSWGAAGCYPCTPWFPGYSGRAASHGYWRDQCNQRFAECKGACDVWPYCTKGISGDCISG